MLLKKNYNLDHTERLEDQFFTLNTLSRLILMIEWHFQGHKNRLFVNRSWYADFCCNTDTEGLCRKAA